MDTGSYPAEAYKPRHYYETILQKEGCDFQHYYGNDKNHYSFSKIVIKQIISVETWGTSPLREREVIHPTTNVPIRYNFWDYKNAFYKTFLYENPDRKHSWFIKICSHVYEQEIPTWFYHWWQSYGPSSINICPDLYKDLYTQWVQKSPAIIKAEEDKYFIKEIHISHFFIQFSIPWIWKWTPEISHTDQNILAIKRSYLTKFWKKMITIKDGIIESQDTIDMIKNTIKGYEEQAHSQIDKEESSPFQKITRRLQIMKGTDQISNKEIMDFYIEEMKKEMMKNLKGASSSKSMSTSSQHEDEEDDILVDSQEDNPEEDLDEEYLQQMIESCKRQFDPNHSSGKNKKIQQ